MKRRSAGSLARTSGPRFPDLPRKFVENQSFKRWLTDVVYQLTCKTPGIAAPGPVGSPDGGVA